MQRKLLLSSDGGGFFGYLAKKTKRNLVGDSELTNGVILLFLKGKQKGEVTANDAYMALFELVFWQKRYESQQPERNAKEGKRNEA